MYWGRAEGFPLRQSRKLRVGATRSRDLGMRFNRLITICGSGLTEGHTTVATCLWIKRASDCSRDHGDRLACYLPMKGAYECG